MRNTSIDFESLRQLSPDRQAAHTVGLDYDGPVEALETLIDLDYPATSPVSITRCSTYDPAVLQVGLRAMLAALDVERRISEATTIVVKVPLVEARHPAAQATPDPRFVSALLSVLTGITGEPGRITVAEGPGHDRDIELVLRDTGIATVLDRHGIGFTDLNATDVVARSALRPAGLDRYLLPTCVVDADLLISVAKLKTHHRAGVSLGMKNLFGCLPGSVYGHPKTRLHYAGVGRVIADLAQILTPHLTIIDGITGMDGTGPLDGDPCPVNVIIAGTGVATTDAAATRVLGFAPALLPQFWYAARHGILRRPTYPDRSVDDVRFDASPPANIPWLAGTGTAPRADTLDLLHQLLAPTHDLDA